MINKGLFFAAVSLLMLSIILTGCGHKQMVKKNRVNNTFDFTDRPSISQLNDGTFIYKDKTYDGVNDMQFGF